MKDLKEGRRVAYDACFGQPLTVTIVQFKKQIAQHIWNRHRLSNDEMAHEMNTSNDSA
jgi:hypothetical protein